jgi:phosphatidylinositol alpha-1,6-mannosyltransferase
MILVVTQTFAPATGGMEAYLTGLAEQLSRAVPEVVVFADSSAGHKDFIPAAPYDLKRFGGFRPQRRFMKRRAVASLVATGKVKGIFCDSWKSVEALPRKLSVPIAIIAHGSEYPPEPKSSKRQRISAALARSQAIIANSRFTADAVCNYLPDKNDPRLMIIHPPLNDLKEPTPQAQAEIRKLIGDRHPVLSVLARLEPRKGVDRVIAALPELIARHPSLVFLIGGRGEDVPRLQALAQETGVSSHVEFLGAVSDDIKTAMLASSDLFTMPVRRVGTSVEGFGICYAEAAWFGVPALAGISGGAADAVIDGETGLLCDGENQNDVTNAIARLLDDGETLKKYGRAASARVRRELTWAHALPQFLNALGKEGEAPS